MPCHAGVEVLDEGGHAGGGRDGAGGVSWGGQARLERDGT